MIKTVKKIISYIMVCVLFLSMCIPCEAAQTSTATASDANATTGFPQITSTSAIIMDAQSGQIIYEKIKQDIGQMIRKLCQYKGIEIHEAEACKDHIHMLVSIPPKYSVSQIMGYLKGKSSLMIYEKYANLKYKYGNRHFWCRGYYVSTVGRNRRAIEEYIKNQLQEDYTDDQLSIKEFVDPFTGEPVRGGK